MKKNQFIPVPPGPGIMKFLIVMKLTAFLLLLNLVSIAGNTYSQGTRISIDLQNKNIVDAFNEIEKVSDYGFFFKSDQLDMSRQYTMKFTDASIKEVMGELLDVNEYSYQVIGRTIVVSKNNSRLNVSQSRPIEGQVTDSKGIPLPGVTIVVKGTQVGTVSDADGKFTLQAPAGAETLVFSFIGMQTQEVSILNKNQVQVSMQETTIGLDEVVAIGYGTMKKSDLTGSVSSVSTEALEDKTISAVDQALQGIAPGVMASTVSGEPGGAMNIRIRGISSYTNASEPLYVIDGIPIIVNEDYSLSSGFQKSNPLASMNPADIQSIEILKDASATSIYGSRGSNGVILITTKKGLGTAKITLDMSYSSQKLIKKIDVASGPELIGLISEFRNTLGYDPIFNGQDIYHPTQGNAKNYDYQDLLFQTAPMYTTNLSISGGTDQTQYYISGNYLNQEGIIIESGFERFGFRVNLDQKIGKNLKIGTNSFFSHTTNNKMATGEQNGLVENLLVWPSFLPVYDGEGNYVDDVVFAESPRPNPVAIAKENSNIERVDRAMLSFFGDYQIFDDLKFTFNASYDGTFQRRDSYQTPKYYPSAVYGGTGSVTNQQITNLILIGYFTYDKDFSEDLSISATAGYETQDYTVEGSSLSGRGFSSPSLGIWGMSSASSEQRGISTNKSKKNLVGYFGRVNLNFQDKYLITGNIRADGSSVFSDNNKWGLFPSGAFAWKLDQEPFIQDLNTFSNLKFRISYGATGNGEIPLYQSQALWAINSNSASYEATGTMKPAFGGNSEGDLVSAAYVTRIANPDLKWEKTAQFDVGFDMGLFDSRIQFSADYYHKKTVDAIIPRAIPKTSGFDVAYMNVGSLLNKGLELNLTGYPFQGDFSWEINANTTLMYQSPIDLSDNDYIFVSGQGGRDSQLGLRMEIGKPAGLLWGYVYDGVWGSQADINSRTTVTSGLLGAYKGVDINGDNVFDGNDKTYIGRSLPTMIFGLSNRFSYKNFDFDFFLQGSYGNDLQIDYWNNLLGMDVNYPTNVLADYLGNYWTPTNTDAKYAGISGASTTTLRPWETNTNNIFDASYIRLKSVTLTYNLNTRTLRVFDSAKFYITGENLLTITNYPGYNPDVASLGMSAFNAGYDNSAYPIAKKFTLGMKFSF